MSEPRELNSSPCANVADDNGDPIPHTRAALLKLQEYCDADNPTAEAIKEMALCVTKLLATAVHAAVTTDPNSDATWNAFEAEMAIVLSEAAAPVDRGQPTVESTQQDDRQASATVESTQQDDRQGSATVEGEGQVAPRPDIACSASPVTPTATEAEKHDGAGDAATTAVCTADEGEPARIRADPSTPEPPGDQSHDIEAVSAHRQLRVRVSKPQQTHKEQTQEGPATTSRASEMLKTKRPLPAPNATQPSAKKRKSRGRPRRGLTFEGYSLGSSFTEEAAENTHHKLNSVIEQLEAPLTKQEQQGLTYTFQTMLCSAARNRITATVLAAYNLPKHPIAEGVHKEQLENAPGNVRMFVSKAWRDVFGPSSRQPFYHIMRTRAYYDQFQPLQDMVDQISGDHPSPELTTWIKSVVGELHPKEKHKSWLYRALAEVSGVQAKNDRGGSTFRDYLQICKDAHRFLNYFGGPGALPMVVGVEGNPFVMPKISGKKLDTLFHGIRDDLEPFRRLSRILDEELLTVLAKDDYIKAPTDAQIKLLMESLDRAGFQELSAEMDLAVAGLRIEAAPPTPKQLAIEAPANVRSIQFLEHGEAFVPSTPGSPAGTIGLVSTEVENCQADNPSATATQLNRDNSDEAPDTNSADGDASAIATQLNRDHSDEAPDTNSVDGDDRVPIAHVSPPPDADVQHDLMGSVPQPAGQKASEISTSVENSDTAPPGSEGRVLRRKLPK